MNTKEKDFRPIISFHPGKTLNNKLNEMEMGVKEFSVRTGKPEKTIFAVLNGDSSVTSDMAIIFENVTGIPARFWLAKQKNYDEFLSRKKQEELMASASAWAQKFPVSEMVNKGWIAPGKTYAERIQSLLAFFGVASQAAWEDYYLNQTLKVAFRISLKSTKDPYAISAWLRRGELQAAEMQLDAPYNAETFKNSIPQIREIIAKHPADFFEQLRSWCAKCGVKIVFTPCLKKAPINGATRWINNTPVIQISGRYKKNDIFWFSFFHEVGHILLHGKKDIFLENVDYDEKQKNLEKEADAFAEKSLLTKAEEAQLLALKAFFSRAEIKSFAQKIGTHPAIIVGRLHHLKKIQYNMFNDLIEHIALS